MANIYIGLMTGTSADSLDLSAVDFSNKKLKVIGNTNFEIPSQLKKQIKKSAVSVELDETTINKLDEDLGRFFASRIENFIQSLSIEKKEVIAIGSHGQTIKHSPNSIPPYSLQIGDPQLMSNKLDMKIIGDFRQDDIEAGGQGAPLSPLFHREVFKDKEEKRIIINIGGITNISILNESKLVGFDTGPGNCLLDAWAKENEQGDYDSGGKWAKSGEINEDLIKSMLNDDYFLKDHPKSTGPDYFNLRWVYSYLKKIDCDLNPADVQATLTELTILSLLTSLKTLKAEDYKVYFCGGGIHNEFMMTRMSTKLNQDVRTTNDLGVDPDFLEAICFAWLAAKRLDNIKFNLKEITGSKGTVFLGRIYKPVK